MIKQTFRTATWNATRRSAIAIALLIALAALFGGQATAQTSSGDLPDVMLDVSVISLTERDDPTLITVTAILREAADADTTVTLGLERSPLITPGVDSAAERDTDYTPLFTDNAITIPSGSLTGETTLTINPIYDTEIEGDEAIVLTGMIAGGVVEPIDIILEDGPYLSFSRHIYGSLSYPGQPVSIIVDEAINKAAADSVVTYALTGEPSDTPLELTFNPVTRQLSGVAPPAAMIPETGLTARYTITARDSVGHEATTLVSVAVARDICSSTASTWFHATDQPPEELVVDCNVLLAAGDTLRGNGTLNWDTDVLIDDWDGLVEFTTDVKWIRKIGLQRRNLDGTIPPILGHLSGIASLDLVLGGDYRGKDPDLDNKLTGPIPPELGLPSSLVLLALSFNDLSGPIPNELANNDRLHSLFLSETGVTGGIPPEFGDLSPRNLTVDGNPGITGHIPWQLGKNVSTGDHPGLQVLNLSSNSLEGTIPWQLGRFGKSQQFALSHNRLTGSIPWQLGNLGNEEAALERRTVELFLNGNMLTGSIPPELSGINNLRVLSLSENRLIGSIPANLGSLSKLEYLYMRHNGLAGSIPPELGNLSELKELFLENNWLSGEIPPELGRLLQLEQLSLSCNGLSGEVPANIGGITTLRVLTMYGNEGLASDRSERPESLQREGLEVEWTGECPEPVTTEPTPVPDPTPTAEPALTADPTPTAEPAPTADPTPTTEPAPTADPTPTTEPALTPEPVATPEPDTQGVFPAWAIVILIAAAVLAAVGGAVFVRQRRRR